MDVLRDFTPAGYTIATLTVSIGGFLNGFDTGSIGAVTVMPQFHTTMGNISSSLIGLTISIILFGGSAPAFFAGQLADKYGRLAVIAAGAMGFAVGCVVQASALSLPQFIAGRAIAGLGEGAYLGVMNVYVCEIAPSKRRGTLASIPQLLVALGICCGYFSCYGLVHVETSLAWRTPFIIMALFAAIMATGCFFLPPSPRWLITEKRREEAVRSIEWLGLQAAEAEKDILRAQESDADQKKAGFFTTLGTTFTRRYRSRTVLALFILGMIQLCGIDAILYYAPTLFSKAGLPEHTAGFLASGISAILILAISIPAAMFADRWGRRTTMLVGGVILTVCMFLLGIMYATNAVHPTGAGRWVVIISIFLFALGYAATWAFVGKIYASEIQPGQTRAATNSLAQGLNFLTNALVALITPILLAHSAYGAYFLFGGLTLGTLVVLDFLMPETRGQPLESIQEIFAAPLQPHGIASTLRQRFGRKPSPSSMNEVDPENVVELRDFSNTHSMVGVAATMPYP